MGAQLIERLGSIPAVDMNSSLYRALILAATTPPEGGECSGAKSKEREGEGQREERKPRHRERTERGCLHSTDALVARVTALSKMLTFKRLLEEVVFFNGIVSRSSSLSRKLRQTNDLSVE